MNSKQRRAMFHNEAKRASGVSVQCSFRSIKAYQKIASKFGATHNPGKSGGLILVRACDIQSQFQPFIQHIYDDGMAVMINPHPQAIRRDIASSGPAVCNNDHTAKINLGNKRAMRIRTEL